MGGERMPWGSVLRRFLVVALCATTMLTFAASRFAASAAEDAKAQADALLARGRELVQQQDFAGAVSPLEQALAIYRRLGLDREDADALSETGGALAKQGQGDLCGAQERWEQSLAIYRRLGLEEQEAGVCRALGGTPLVLGETAQSPGYLERAANLYRKLGQRENALDSLVEALKAPRIIGARSQDGRAKAYLEQLMTVCHEAEPGKEQTELLRRAARGLFDAGLYLGAQQCVEEELAAEGKPAATGPVTEAATRARLEQDLARYGQPGREKERASTLCELAKLCDDLAQYDKALGYYGQALAIWRQLGLQKDEASTLDGLGKLSVEQAQYDKALGYYGQALAIWRKLGMPSAEADELDTLGQEAGVLSSFFGQSVAHGDLPLRPHAEHPAARDRGLGRNVAVVEQTERRPRNSWVGFADTEEE